MLEDVDLVEIHKIDTNVSSILGIVLSIYLIYLIIYKTVSEMKSYSRILMQGCLVDLFLSVATFFAAPIILLQGSAAYLVVNNFLENMPYFWRFVITMIWIFFFTLVVPSTPVQFVYRYFVFCRGTNFTRLHYAGFLLVPFSNAFIYCFMVVFAVFPEDSDIERANQAIGFLFPNGQVSISLIADARKPLMLTILGINLITNATSYITVIWCSFKMWKYVRDSAKHVKKSTREAQSQLTKALFCQMLSPITLVQLPLVYIVGTMILGNPDARLSIVLNLGFSWTPVFNNLTTIYFVRPYRVATMNYLFGRCFSISQTWYNGQASFFSRRPVAIATVNPYVHHTVDVQTSSTNRY